MHLCRHLKKGIMWGSIGPGQTIMEKFQAAKDAGFDGVEVMSHLDRNEVLKARDATGLAIPSVCGAIPLEVSSFRSRSCNKGTGSCCSEVSLEDAAAYGADTVLLVPGSVSETVAMMIAGHAQLKRLRKLFRWL